MARENEEKEYHIYRKTNERVTVKATCLSEAWRKGKELLGPPLIDCKAYDDRLIRVRMKCIRGKIDEDKE